MRPRWAERNRIREEGALQSGSAKGGPGRSPASIPEAPPPSLSPRPPCSVRPPQPSIPVPALTSKDGETQAESEDDHVSV